MKAWRPRIAGEIHRDEIVSNSSLPAAAESSPGSSPSRWRRRLTAVLNLGAVAWFLYVLEALSDTGSSILQLLVMIEGRLALLVLGLINLGIHLWVHFRNRNRLSERWTFVWLCAPLIVVMIYPLLAKRQGSLLELRLSLSAPALASTGRDTWREPRLVGLFIVSEKLTMGSELRFRTADCHFFDDCGLVLSPEGPPQPIGEDSFVHLTDSWWHWRDSW